MLFGYKNPFFPHLVHRTAHDNKIFPHQIPKGLRAKKLLLVFLLLFVICEKLHFGKTGPFHDV